MMNHSLRRRILCALAPALLLGHLLCPAVTTAAEPKADSTYVPAGYVKVFGDEMEGTQLDTSKWWTRYVYNNGMLDTLNDERQRYAENDNHVMNKGVLELTARVHPDPKNERFQYQSGMIRSKVTFKYGYFESRVKFPKGKGVWAAYWFNSDARESDSKLSWPPEVDVFEFVYNEKDDKLNMFHTGFVARGKDGPSIWGAQREFAAPEINTKKGMSGHFHAKEDLTADWHVFGALWESDDTWTLFLDGKPYMKGKYKWVYADKTDAGYAHILLNLAIGGKWAGRHGIDDSAFPQALEVDYVRAYQKPDQKLMGVGKFGKDLIKPTTAPADAKAN